MTATTSRTGRLAALVAAVTALATAAPATASYGWPVKPFDEQHPIRGYFGDPRIAGHDVEHASFHFGVDIAAPDGTPVYATVSGVAAAVARDDRDAVAVIAGATAHEYWHVVPAVRPGDRVVARQTVIGHVLAPWAHVHFSEVVGGRYVNPLRRGALSPYRDTTRPTIHTLAFERDGVPAGRRLRGTVDLVAEAWDDVPVAVAAPWNAKPVAPAIVWWRVVGRNVSSPPWRVAVDFRDALPDAPFAAVYARWTRQNHPWTRGGRGRYRFVLARRFDTTSLADGTYTLQVRAADTRGNARARSVAFEVANGGRT